MDLIKDLTPIYLANFGNQWIDRFQSALAIAIANETFALVYNVDKDIVGFILFSAAQFDNEILSINQLVIHPDYQNQGRGRELLNDAFKWAKERKMDYAMLSTEIPDYYSKLGWSIINTHRKKWHVMGKTIQVLY